MSITYNELLHGHNIADVPLTAQQHLEVLLVRINSIRTAWGKPMIVTSGYRTAQDQQRINPAVTRSKHMTGDAVDIADPDGSLYTWAYANQDILEACELWCESGTKGWVHFQCVPYGSWVEGKSRFFQP